MLDGGAAAAAAATTGAAVNVDESVEARKLGAGVILPDKHSGGRSGGSAAGGTDHRGQRHDEESESAVLEGKLEVDRDGCFI